MLFNRKEDNKAKFKNLLLFAKRKFGKLLGQK